MEHTERLDAIRKATDSPLSNWMDSQVLSDLKYLVDRLASARAIMQKFVDKVDRGMAKSIETYTEMKQWMEEE